MLWLTCGKKATVGDKHVRYQLEVTEIQHVRCAAFYLETGLEPDVYTHKLKNCTSTQVGT